jgi:hypothetical protein
MLFPWRMEYFLESDFIILNIFRKCFTLYINYIVETFGYNFIANFLSREGEGLAQ